MSRAKLFRIWLAPLLYMALIFVASSIPLRLPPIVDVPFQDKLWHVVEYALLGWLCWRASRQTWPQRSAGQVWVFAVLVATLWGLSDELHQSFVPGRSAEFSDALADFLGALLGAWSAQKLHQKRKIIA